MNTTIVQQETAQSQPLTAWLTPLNPNDCGDALYIAGYRAYVKSDGALIVRKPDGTRYMVSPYQQTCTCRASVKCKHLKGLTNLVWLSFEELEFNGKYEASKRIMEYWNDWTAAHARKTGGR